MTTTWAHLPNARHIDAMLADAKARPDVWKAARATAIGIMESSSSRYAAWGKAWSEAETVVTNAPDRDSVRYAVYTAARSSAWDTVLALLAWDNSADLLDHPPDVLRAMADLADAPVCYQAALLLPYALVRSES